MRRCPKCGLKCVAEDYGWGGIHRLWACGSADRSGPFNQSKACSIRQLEAENRRLKRQLKTSNTIDGDMDDYYNGVSGMLRAIGRKACLEYFGIEE